MRKIKIMEHISLDGVISPGERYEGDQNYVNGEWTAPYGSGEGLEAVLEAHGGSFDLLLGRLTYDIWSGYWPRAESSPLANSLNAATKYVATHRPESLEWGPVEALGQDLLAGIRNLKSTDGPELILWGSSTLVSVLLEHGLGDEVVLMVYPVLLGRGKRFFSDCGEPRELVLVSTKSTTTGVLINTYRYVGSLLN